MPDFSIECPDAADWPIACDLLFANLPPDQRRRQTDRLIELLAANEFDPRGLLVARQSDQIIGSVLVQSQTGASGLVWPPNADSLSIEDALTNAGLHWLGNEGVKQSQMLLPPDQFKLAEAWQRCGFRRVTRLQSLHRPVGLPLDRSTSRLHWNDADDCMDEFMDVWLASYVGTLDCPELNGIRTPAEVVAGHHALRGNAAWSLAQLQGESVGVLSLVRGQAGIVELDYLGLHPNVRGLGLGREMLHRAIRQAQAWETEWMRVSVDERNSPALKLYEQTGFQLLDELDVYLWPIELLSNHEVL